MMKLYNGQLKAHEFTTTREDSHKAETWAENILTFDIETTSAWRDKSGNIEGYHPGESDEYWNSLESCSLCYIWQFSIDGVVYYGRELREFLNVLKDLPKDINIIIWVHNLGYEFEFLSNIITWDKVFARSAHNPIKATCKEFPNIIFRCSYALAGMSLDSWGKQLGVKKLTGHLDYEKIRTPFTVLTPDELEYCEADCRVVEAGITMFRQRYGSLKDIPLTQTGTVRAVVRDLLCDDKDYLRKMRNLLPRTAQMYNRLKYVFSGGYTHANAMKAGEVITGIIEHYDFASSYPTVMIAEKYPMTPFHWLYNVHEIPDESTFNEYAYMMELRFTGLNSTSENNYISSSKCSCDGVRNNYELDNGRIIKADTCTIWVTEQDYITIRKNYEWDGLEVKQVFRSKKEYLPLKFVQYILELYKNKTELKGVAGQEELYNKSKQYINSLYGMCVTALVQSDVIYNGNEWKIPALTESFVDEQLNDLRNSYPGDRRTFLCYAWGCWVTAYARRNLWKCIESCDEDVIYCDTDSIFTEGRQNFEWYNIEITEKLRKVCEERGLDFESTRPYTKNGKQKPLGVFEKEDDCTEFVTLGAKRYVERRASDGQLHMTVSGINKSAVAVLNDNIYNFRDGVTFDKDAPEVTKKMHTYIHDQPVICWPDGYISDCTHGIALRRIGYKIKIKGDYKSLIGLIDEIPEQFNVSKRGFFYCQGGC